MVRFLCGLMVSALLAASCGGGGTSRAKPTGLRINEVMASDEGGTIIDERGRIGDWVELVNTGDTAVDLGTHTLADGTHTGAPLCRIAVHSSWTRRRPTANESSKKLNPTSPNRSRRSATSAATEAALR